MTTSSGNLRTQTLHVNVHQSRVGGVAVAPHLLEQLLARKNLPGRTRERGQQVELEGRQRNDATAAFHDVASDVDREVLEREPLVGLGVLTPTQASAHARHQFLGLEGLGHVVVRSGLESGDYIGGVRTSGQHYDRSVGDSTDRPTHVETIHPGQHDVQENKVRIMFLKVSKRL